MNHSINQTLSLYDWILLILLSVLWGGSFFFVELIVAELAPLTTVALRVSLAAPVLWIVVFMRGLRCPQAWVEWKALLGMGILNNVIPFTLIVWAQTQIESGLASILNATTPLFAVVIAGIVLVDEKLTCSKIVGAVIGFTGTAYMIGGSVLVGLGDSIVHQIAVIGATMSYGFAGAYGRRFTSLGLSTTTTAAGQVTASSLMLIPLAMFVDKPDLLSFPGWEVAGAVIALAVFSTALAYILFFQLLASAGAMNVMLVTFLIPISTIFLGYSVLGERLESRHFIGMVVIAMGFVVIDGRLLKYLRN